MLLEIKNNNHCTRDLLRATRLAGKLFDYAADWPNPAFDLKDFKKHLPFKPVRNLKPVREALDEIIRLTKAERDEIRAAFYHDIKFYRLRYRDSAAFQFKYPQLAPHVQLAGKMLLTAFYENVLGGSGFKDLPRQKVSPLNRAAVERAYRETNPDFLVCPACLEWLSETIKTGGGGERSLVDRDHFFPKSIYPPLAVHPFNLTVICSTCNSRVKGGKNPIRPEQRGSLRESFIPYVRPGLNEIELEFFKGRRLRVKGRPGVSYAGERAENFDNLYELSQRWSHYLASFDVTIRKKLNALANKLGIKPADVTEQQVAQVLEGYVENSEMTKFTMPMNYVMMHYAQWLLDNRLSEFHKEYLLAQKP